MASKKVVLSSYGTTHSGPYRLHLPPCHRLSLQLCGALGDLFAWKVRPRYTIARSRRIATSVLLKSMGLPLPIAYAPLERGYHGVVPGIAADGEGAIFDKVLFISHTQKFCNDDAVLHLTR